MIRPEISDAGTGKRAFLVDDDDAFRRSFAELLEANDWTAVCFGSVREFLAQAASLEPGIVLLDLHLRNENGLRVLEAKLPELERFAVVMVTGAGEIPIAVRCMKAGALDFIEKPFVASEVLERLDQLHSLFLMSSEANAARLEAKRRVAALSKREREVLERMPSGASNKAIARSLDLSPRTVEMHRARMLQKLGAKTTAQALEMARLAGLEPVNPDPQGGGSRS